MMGHLFRKISSGGKLSARKLRDVRPKCIQLEEIKDPGNTATEKIGVRLPRNRLQEVIDFFWDRTSSPTAIKILSNSLKLAFGRYSTLNRPRDIDIVLAGPRDFHRGERPIVPIKTRPSALDHLLNRASFTHLTPRFRSVTAINYAKRKLSFKFLDRGADKNQEPARSKREPSPASREIREDRSESEEDPNAEYLRSVQRASPSYSKKPEVYRAKLFSDDREKSAETDRGGNSTDFEQQRRSNPRTISQSDKAYDRSCDGGNDRRSARDTIEEKRTRVSSNVDRIVACVRKHSPYLRWLLSKKSEKRTSKSVEWRGREDTSEETRPDPSPPKSVHWSERTKRSRASLSSRLSPIVFVPHEEGSKKRKTPARKVNDKVSRRNSYLPRKTRYENGDKKCFSARKYARSRANFVAYTGGRSKEQLRMGKSKDDPGETRRIARIGCKLHKTGETGCLKKSVGYLPRRERRERFESSGEWKRQEYRVRLKIFKKPKNGLDPCPPVTIRAQRLGDRFSPEEIKKPGG
ncbi:hypothetical protein K0M31_019821 [Melipona bicolor]|uniref:Uncharacterized protein n=1 Tax=Melipona bicolor TaxID=60889 RepID=A0AA40KRS9_9HYME|nr:hypothetical protein K0M31_019821 [Melipona bicolor]